MNKKETMYFVYPAYFLLLDGEVIVSFPDLELVIEGDSYEEAFLFAKNYLKEFLKYALKNEYEIPMPTLYSELIKDGSNAMLVDAYVFPAEIK